jgi:PAS domain S-box-containing protein
METLEPLFQPELELTYPDGVTRWNQVSKIPLINSDGTSSQVLVVLIDITERKQAEEAQRRSEAQYRAAVEDHPGFIYRYTPDFKVTFVNKTFCDFFGISPEDILGHSILDIVAEFEPDNVEVTRQQIARITPEQPVQMHEHGVTNSRGEERWVRWVDRLLLDENGDPVEYQASGLDITDRQQAEEALEEQRRFLRQIIDANPNMIFVRDYAGRYVLMNKKAAELIGWDTLDMSSEAKAHADFDQEQAGRFLKQDHFVMDTGQDLFIPEEEIVLPSGEKRWVQTSKHALVGPDGRADRVLVVLVDISERKKMEASMVDAEKLAGLGTLAAGIAHEINSPLQIITGKTESLQRRLERDRVDTGALNNDLSAINRNAWRVAQIVRSLLDYAHPVAGEIQPMDINTLIKDTLLLIEHQFKTWSNITVQTELAEELPLLQCTSDEISRMLINLLTNARDAMPEGGQITIRTRHDPDESAVFLEVADTGPGIPEEILSNIFDPFFTTKAVGKGTGLGLFIVHGIVQSRGGQIDVSSRAGEGTTFSISLPLELRPAKQDSPGRYQT